MQVAPAVAAQQSGGSDARASPPSGRRGAGAGDIDFNDPEQRPLGGRWSKDNSAHDSGQGRDLSPYDNPLGGRLQYDDSDEGQVCGRSWCVQQRRCIGGVRASCGACTMR